MKLLKKNNKKIKENIQNEFSEIESLDTDLEIESSNETEEDNEENKLFESLYGLPLTPEEEKE